MEKKVANINRPPGMQGGTVAPGILPGIGPNSLKDMRCKNCKCPSFIATSRLKMASPLQTQHGQPQLVNFNAGFACMKCGQINQLEEVTDKMRIEEQVPPKEEQN